MGEIWCSKEELELPVATRQGPSHATVTGQLADTPTRGLPTRGLDKSRTGQLAASQMLPKRKTKHAKSPMASASCPVTHATVPNQ